MDTTSHNFNWQQYTFGDGGPNILRDVAIINENNIWAVGEIYVNDSLGNPDPNLYNAVHWDGSNWELKRITVDFRGNLITPTLEGAFVFSSTDIWFVGSLPIHGDGENWVMYDLRTTVDPNLSLSKAWGSGTNDMYFVGRSGSIAHYNGIQWRKIESGTLLRINDIYGDINNFTGEIEIICVASEGNMTELLKIQQDNSVQKLDKSGLGNSLNSIWFLPDKRYYTVGDGLYEKRYNNLSIWTYINISPYYLDFIRGTGLNNLVVAGGTGEVLHYNGISWKSLKSEQTDLGNGWYTSAAVKGNIAVAAGLNSEQGVILLGRHQ